MPTRHKLGCSSLREGPFSATLSPVRPPVGHGNHHRTLDTVLSLSELAARLGVTVQTIYDLRSQGRGPRGFRVGRELRFRISEIDAWLACMEEADAARHPQVARP